MSDARNAAMAKITASIDGHESELASEDVERLADEEMQLDEAAGVQSSKELLEAQRLKQTQVKTETDILRLEEAKEKASSQTVKDELQEEIDRAKEPPPEPPQEGISVPGVVGRVNDQAWNTINRVQTVAGGIWDQFARVATPGTIFLPVTVLLIFFFLLLPVNGYTRAQWLWMALTGSASIKGEQTPTQTPPPGSLTSGVGPGTPPPFSGGVGPGVPPIVVVPGFFTGVGP